ncbi:preprotein translocase subunit SecA [Clostridium massiliamazoniense]|uniref:preprotein translocase subunit SecA n=1 Tax=Clostridium massiliamazoniense TaxID=1347366 RepID=UPI0006D7D3BB|nr:preprotein translocase subunit SecA [Clostridium massiliamazoniense]
MIKGLLNLFGDYSKNEIKVITSKIEQVEALDSEFSKLTDEQLKNKTEEFRKRLKAGETLDDILIEAFATVREAAYRVLGMKHYRVQMIGGLIIHQGRVAEMKTGEGKTLVATLPAYLNGLDGKGVHILTSNEYLAKRDSDEMGAVHRFLGLTVSCILHEMEIDERRAAYNCDITYGTTSEVGFDYLKDNMVTEKEERVQRGLNYVIIDEIDSILIDEARTPLIISGGETESSDYYIEIDEFAKKLKKDIDFEVDEKKKAVTLTPEGIKKIEKYFKIENYGDLENVKLQHHLTQAMKANYTMSKDIDYIINDKDEVLIVDLSTGRVMDGRRFSDGLHQAIEAKEEVEVQAESKTLATITLQNLFRMYNKLSGMSGTVLSEEKEFREVYDVDVITIPTNKPIQRIDNGTVVYKTLSAKYDAIVKDIEETYRKGQPVLVGTSSIQKSEDISAILKRKGIPHNVLNAKSHKLEAEIIKEAGKVGKVTIATNMAGRGTDIKLPKESLDLGGLKIIGTERHDSVRVDNQLRGRAGRQGEIGESLIYVSLEDDVMKNYISEKYKKILDKLELDEKKAIEFSKINTVVDNAQKAVEGDSFAARKDVIGYDDVLDKQRHVIYEQRNIILEKDSIEDEVLKMIEFTVNYLTTEYYNGNQDIKKETERKIREIFLIDNNERLSFANKETLAENLYKKAKSFYDGQKINLGLEEFDKRQRKGILDSVDKYWIEYLSEVDYLKLGIGLRSMKQQDPVQAFQIEASDMFIKATEVIRIESTREIFKNLKKVTETTVNLV